jgi:hypothetical protein
MRWFVVKFTLIIMYFPPEVNAVQSNGDAHGDTRGDFVRFEFFGRIIFSIKPSIIAPSR